jgi:hypothetical protein
MHAQDTVRFVKPRVINSQSEWLLEDVYRAAAGRRRNGGCVEAPNESSSIFCDAVDNSEQFAHDCDERLLWSFVRSKQALIIRAQPRIETDSG